MREILNLLRDNPFEDISEDQFDTSLTFAGLKNEIFNVM